MAMPALLQPVLNERDLRVRNHGGALHTFYLDALLGLVPVRTHRAEQVVSRQHEGLLVEWARAARGLVRVSILGSGFQSLVCLGAILLLGAELLRRSGVDASLGRTAVFVALVLGVLMLILANRGRVHSVLGSGQPGNPWLWRMAVVVVGLLTLVIGVPMLRELMGLAWPDATALIAAAAMTLSGAAWLAGLHAWRRVRAQPPLRPGAVQTS